MPIIDVHDHILSREHAHRLARFGGHRCSLARDAEGRTVVMRAGAPAAEVARVMNDHLAEVCARWPRRFRGLGSVPLQDIGDTAGCVRRIDTLPIGEVDKELSPSRNPRRLFKLSWA
jgi:hypothetical protein